MLNKSQILQNVFLFLIKIYFFYSITSHLGFIYGSAVSLILFTIYNLIICKIFRLESLSGSDLNFIVFIKACLNCSPKM